MECKSVLYYSDCFNPNFNKQKHTEIRIICDMKMDTSPEDGGFIPKHVVSVSEIIF